MSSVPGTRNSHRGLYMRKKRSVRQPSRKVLRCGACAARPSGCRVIGTSAMRTPAEARLDDHLRGELHPRAPLVELAGSSRLREAAQARSTRRGSGALNHRRASQENIGLPHQRWSNGIAPGSTRAAARLAAGSPGRGRSPRRSFVHEPGELEEVVAVVGVAHDDVLAPGGRDAAHQRAAVPGLGARRTTRAPARVAISCEPSVLPLSATITSPAIAFSRSAGWPSRRTSPPCRPRSGRASRPIPRCRHRPPWRARRESLRWSRWEPRDQIVWPVVLRRRITASRTAVARAASESRLVIQPMRQLSGS